MPYEISWEDKPHVVYIKAVGVVTEEELVAGIDEAIRLALEVPDSRVHTLLDCSALEQLPPIPVTAREFRRMMQESPNRATSTLSGLNRVMRLVVEMVIKVTGTHVRIFDTLEEARTFIQQIVASERQIAQRQDDIE